MGEHIAMTNYLLVLLAVALSTANAADFTTYVGSDNNQYVVSQLATDSAGDTYVTGVALVTKLDPTGNIVFTIPAGGQCCTFGDAIAADSAGNVWVGGNTNSPNFPLVNALQPTPPPSPSNPGSGIGFLMKMAPDGTVLYSSYFGGVQGTTTVSGIATDQSGNVYLTGVTSSSDFPTTAGLPASAGSINGAFVTKLSSNGQKVIYSTVIAGTSTNCSGTGCTSAAPYTAGSGIAVDGSGNVLVAGSTNTTDLPVPSGSTAGTGPFALKINAAGNQLVYVTFIGPPPGVVNGVKTSTGIGGRPIAADASGNAYIAGNTNSPAFSTTPGAYQTTNATSPDSGEGFAMKLDPEGATIWATLLGSDLNGSGAYAIALDSSDNVWLTGGDGFVSGTAGSFVAELSADGSARSYLEQFPTEQAGLDIAIDTSGVVHVLGQGSLVSTITGTSSAPRVLSILNAAGGVGQLTTGLIAPGEIISLYGSGLSPTSPIAATPQNGVFPTILGGVQVLVNGSAIPLLYVSGSQINAEVPSPLNGVENGIAVTQVVYSTTEWDPVQQITFMTALPEFRLAVVDSQFAVFRNQTGSLAIINQDGTVNKIANPAKVGSVVSMWASGFGSTGPKVNGSVSAAANNYCSSCEITLSFGETNVTEAVQYAGTSPGLIDGLMQINFLIPTQLIFNGAWVYFTPPGATQPLMLGWVDTTQ
jgi:uncharacterized protein (TIGR03437 family)